MTTYYDEDGNEVDPFNPQPQQQEQTPGWRRALDERNTKSEERAKTAEARVAQLERTVAFAEAGINLTDPKAKWLVKGYEGELTADAISAAAAELGLAPGTSQEVVGQDEAAAHQRMADAAAGQAAPGARDYDGEMRAAAAANDQNLVNRIYQEKHTASGRTGPAIATD